MRRYWVVALAVLTFLGMLSPPAVAQAPAPKVTITGLLDTVTSAHWNLSQIDLDNTRARDTMWVSRQRGVFFINAEVDKAKAVLGLELDLGWGMTSVGMSGGGTSLASAPQLAFSTGTAFGASNDVLNVFEIKHMYVEFPVPLVPVPTTVRLGGQPGVGVAQYKPVVYFDDFPGVYLVSTFTPAVKFHFLVALHDEDATGCPKKDTPGRNAGACSALLVIPGSGTGTASAFGTRASHSRGDDFVLGASLDVTPVKELQVRPFWLHYEAKGFPTNSQNTPLFAGIGGVVLNNAGSTGALNRDQARQVLEYFGLDARWRSGPWYLDPTLIYVYGLRDLANQVVGSNGGVVGQDIRSWMVDVRGGYRIGPLNLEGFFLYTPGNDARDNIGQYGTGRKLADQNWFNPINTGGAYGATWSNFFATNEVDYIRAPYIGTSMASGTIISLDRYGRISAAFGPSYALTPALTFKGLVAAHWTEREVDNHGVMGAAGWTPETAGGDINGDDSYLGTEFALGLTWRFAPGLTFDTSVAHLFAGDALRQCKNALVGGVCGGGGGAREIRDARDATSLAARVRFTF